MSYMPNVSQYHNILMLKTIRIYLRIFHVHCLKALTKSGTNLNNFHSDIAIATMQAFLISFIKQHLHTWVHAYGYTNILFIDA